MSEHIHVCETTPNATVQAPSPSATASSCDDAQCHADHHRQVTGEREVEQDAILGDHAPDDQGGCQRSTESPSSCCGSTASHSERGTLSKAWLALWGFRLLSLTCLAQPSSLPGDIDTSHRDNTCSSADMSCAHNSPNTPQPHRGRRCRRPAVLER